MNPVLIISRRFLTEAESRVLTARIVAREKLVPVQFIGWWSSTECYEYTGI